MLVLAGPGSGKTTVISERVRYLIEEKGVEPDRILTITFTKAAAQEMQRRCRQICPRAEYAIFGTFHSVFYHFLLTSEKYRNFTLIHEKEKRQILQKLLPLSDMTRLQKQHEVETMLQKISAYKNNSMPSDGIDSGFLQVYKRYCQRCRERELLDFDDMLMLCQELFEEFPKEKEKWQKRFLYVLVDEFQDVNSRQYELTRCLVEETGNLFAVGDDDQAIYSFRGSDPGYMKRFLEDFPRSRTVYLEENFRCGNQITSLACDCISNNGQRFAKHIRSCAEYQDLITLESFETQEKEVKQIASFFSYAKNGGTEGESRAVLVRTNQQVEYIAEMFRSENIPCCIREKRTCFYENEWIQDILAIFRFVTDGQKRSDFLVFMNKPYRGLARDTMKEETIDWKKLYVRAKESGQGEVAEDIRKLEQQCRLLHDMDPYGAIRLIMCGMHYRTYVNEVTAGNSQIMEQAEDVIRQLKERTRGYKSISAFLKHVEEYVRDFDANRKSERKTERQQMNDKQEPEVQIMTYHASKGLEFDRVFLPMLNSGIVPHGHMLNTEETEEERRMFYVAMTRAKKRLHMSWHGKQEAASIFLKEIKKGLFKETARENYRSSSNSALSRYSSKASETASYSASSEI